MRTAGGTTERIPFGEKALLWKSRLSDVNSVAESMGKLHNKSANHYSDQGSPVLADKLSVHYRLGSEHLQSAAFLAKSLSDVNRLRILLFISDSRKSVSAIVEELDLSQPLVSHHLKELKRSLLVKVERKGPFIYYELADVRILTVLQTLSEVATDLLSARKTF
jgi:DNA-binding transcriptional ArsR family regulator